MASAITATLALGYNLQGGVPQLRPAVRCTNPACSMMQPQLPRAAASAAAAAALAATIAASPALAADPWPYSTLISKVQADDVAKVAFSTDGTKVVAFDQEGRDHQVNIFPGGDAELVTELRKHQVQFAVVPPPEANPALSLLGGFGSLLINFLPLILLIGLNLLASRGGPGGMGGGPMGGPGGIGKAQSKIQMEPNTGVTFLDVAGCDASKQELTEIVEFLKNPGKYSALGAKIPRGAVMEGPPGTGKTLLARAVAHHTDCTFIRVSGGELVQKYIGEGSRMVRELFVMAREHAPSIIFMDEIDSIGGQRQDGESGGDSEVQRTMLELLNQLDGFEATNQIKVVMATNRLDILDSALLRPGRIDRKIEFPNPNEDARLDILTIHSRRMNLMRGINMRKIAASMHEASGAETKAVCTEAGMFALRERRVHVTQDDFEMAVAKVMKKDSEKNMSLKKLWK
mmetsp:Transcript_10906/g.28689  ORF Transcript_10906/g.28689 Transcript_10906/m.28689 type:complete len:459 (-) Transcript_10906:29-1405(-)